MRRRSFLHAAPLWLAATATASCNDRPMLDLYPSAVIEVDTNLPVPLAISRLRIDLYSEDGTGSECSDDRCRGFCKTDGTCASFCGSG